MSEKGCEVLEALRRAGVWSGRMRKKLADILLDRDPPHLKRVFLGGFLLYAVGLSVEQVVSLIERYGMWVDFDRRITERNLRGIHKRKGSSNSPKSSGPTSDKSEVSRLSLIHI